MDLDARVREMRKQALASGGEPVPRSFQGVAKPRIAELLRALDLETRDRVDAVFALLDDVHESWFPTAPAGSKFCHGASTGHIGRHIGILQRDRVKLDREGRDYWIKPLREIGAVEAVLLDSKARAFVPGHPVAKSPKSAYRLTEGFKRILLAPETQWKALLDDWASKDNLRERLAFQASQADESRRQVDAAHRDLIHACVKHYVKRFLAGFEVVYVDDSDGERVTDEDRERLRDAGLELGLGDAMPDVLLHNDETNELWVIEAVTSDGEVDEHKVRRLVDFAARHMKDGVGFTTAYPSWKVAAQRQSAHKNIPAATYVWIRDDASKHYRAEAFGADGSTPSAISSKRS
jgi:hypothetical protein